MEESARAVAVAVAVAVGSTGGSRQMLQVVVAVVLVDSPFDRGGGRANVFLNNYFPWKILRLPSMLMVLTPRSCFRVTHHHHH